MASPSDDDVRRLVDLFDPAPEPEWHSPHEVSRLSLDSFVESRQDLGRTMESTGALRLIDGGQEDAHSARLDVVGRIMTSFQRLIASTGSAIEGEKSHRGQLSAKVRSLTQLRLAASPQPGSVLLAIHPEKLPEDELRPEGQQTLIDGELLVDRSMATFVALVQSSADASPGANEEDPFLSLLGDLGPRTAGALREFVQPLAEQSITIDFDWMIPSRPALRLHLAPSDAERIVRLVAVQKLDVERVELIGRLHTISKTRHWELETSEGVIDLARGSLPESILTTMRLDQPVRVVAEMAPRRQPTGDVTFTYTAISIEPASEDPTLA